MEIVSSKSSFLAKVAALQNTIRDTLERALPVFERFSLLDFPDHSNVGDSAIWLGETSYFLNVHKKFPSFVNSIIRNRMDETISQLPDGLVVLHGGGNFGDVYPDHHAWREEFLRRTKGRPVVQMPQSIHFQDQQRLSATARVIEAHGQFTLFVRDHVSLKIAQDNFQCPVFLCPDMAFMLGSLHRSTPTEFDIFCLMRTDDEKVGYDIATAADNFSLTYNALDWLAEPSSEVEKLRTPSKWQRALHYRMKGLSRSHYRNLGFHLMAQHRLYRGIDMLSTGRWVITDRLHAHILSVMLAIPHVVLDNNYGKIRNFRDAWTSDVNDTHAINSAAEAVSFVSEQVRST